MKIYYRESYPNFYFMTRRENGLWCMNLQIPDIDTLVLCECCIGVEEEDKAWEEAVEASAEDTKIFDTFYDKKGNYQTISNVLKSVFSVTQEEIDKIYDRNPEMMEFTKELAVHYKISDYEVCELYRKVKRHMNTWSGDKERVKKYLIEHGDIGIKIDGTIVDIFGECHPTARLLLHDFHNYWGKELDALVEEAVEKYPDENDFDLAYYYVKEKLFPLRKEK